MTSNSSYDLAIKHLNEVIDERDAARERVKRLSILMSEILDVEAQEIRGPRNTALIGVMTQINDFVACIVWRCPREDQPEHWHWNTIDRAALPQPSCEGVESIPHSEHHGD